MQEEVEQRIVSLMISCGKLGEQEFRKAVAKLLEQLKNGHQKHQYSKANPHGKMTVKQLAAKDKGLQSIEVTDQNIGSFNRIARKFGKPFPQEQELTAKTARLIELDMELNLDGKGQPQPEQAIAKSARPSVLDRLKAPPVHGAPEKPHKKEMEAR